MEKHIPGPKRPRWIQRKAIVEMFAGVPPLVASVVGAVQLNLKPETKGLVLWAMGICVWLGVSTVVKVWNAHVQDGALSTEKDVDGLRAALCVLHATAGNICNIEAAQLNQSLRVTFHRVVPPDNGGEQFLEQHVNYVGGNEGGAGRKFSVSCGITGLAVRTGKPFTSSFVGNDLERRRAELIENWGYTSKQVQALSLDRRSSMAIPISDATGHHVLGVVYLDSDREDLFESTEVQSSIIVACAGISKFVGEKYPK